MIQTGVKTMTTVTVIVEETGQTLRVPTDIKEDEVETLVAVQTALPYVPIPPGLTDRLLETVLPAVKQNLKPGSS
jgi:hypothetical protein